MNRNPLAQSQTVAVNPAAESATHRTWWLSDSNCLPTQSASLASLNPHGSPGCGRWPFSNEPGLERKYHDADPTGSSPVERESDAVLTA